MRQLAMVLGALLLAGAADAEGLKRRSWEVHVKDPEGKPVAGAAVLGYEILQDMGWTELLCEPTNKRGVGKARLTMRWNGMPDSTGLEIYVVAPGYAYALKEIPPEETGAKRIDVTLEPGERTTLRVLLPDGSPAPTSTQIAMVSQRTQTGRGIDGGRVTLASAVSEGEGLWSFRFPKSATLVPVVDVPGSVTAYVGEPMTSADSGRTITLPAPGTLDVQLSWPDPEKKTKLYGGMLCHQTAATRVWAKPLAPEQFTSFRFEDLAPGNYSFTVYGESGLWDYPLKVGSGAVTEFRSELKQGGTAGEPPAPPTLQPGMPAPDFALETLDGTGSFKLSDYKGKVVYLDFWATWCGPCQKPMQHNADVMARRTDWKDRVVIIAASCDEDAPALRKHVADKKWENLVHGRLVERNDEQKLKAFQLYEFRGIPTCFLIDESGTVVWRGHPAEKEMEPAIDAVLARKATP